MEKLTSKEFGAWLFDASSRTLNLVQELPCVGVAVFVFRASRLVNKPLCKTTFLLSIQLALPRTRATTPSPDAAVLRA